MMILLKLYSFSHVLQSPCLHVQQLPFPLLCVLNAAYSFEQNAVMVILAEMFVEKMVVAI